MKARVGIATLVTLTTSVLIAPASAFSSWPAPSASASLAGAGQLTTQHERANSHGRPDVVEYRVGRNAGRGYTIYDPAPGVSPRQLAKKLRAQGKNVYLTDSESTVTLERSPITD